MSSEFRPTHDLRVRLSNGDYIICPVMKVGNLLISLSDFANDNGHPHWTLNYNTLCYRGVAVVVGRTIIDECIVVGASLDKREG